MTAWPHGLLDSVDAEERRVAVGGFWVLFGLLAGHTLLETARDATFLAHLPAHRLPVVYLGVTGVSIFLMAAQRMALPSQRGSGVLSGTVAAGAVITAILWSALPTIGVVGPYVLYIWSGVFATIGLFQFWSTLSACFTITQAKRLYSFVGTGAVAGAIVGSGIAGLMASVLPPRHLLLGVVVIWLLTAVVVGRLPAAASNPSPGAEPPAESMLEGLGLVARRPYLRWVGAVVLLSAVTLTLADFLFKTLVAETVAPGQLASFFARTYFALYLLSFAVQTLGVGRAVRRLGVITSGAILPTAILFGAGGIGLGGGLIAALALKTADGSLRQTLHRTATELLFVPISDRVRGRVKGLIDVVGQRGGQAAASALLLVLASAGVGEVGVAAALAASASLWVLAVALLKRPYFDVFRRGLRDLRSGALHRPLSMDVGSLESLFGALNSPDEAAVVAAIEHLTDDGRSRLVPALILCHPSSSVVVAASEQFARDGRVDFVPVADAAMERASPEARAALFRARSTVDPDLPVLRAALGSPWAGVRATAAVALLRLGAIDVEEAERHLREVLRGDDAAARVAVARAARDCSGPLIERVVIQLAASTDPGVRREALRSMSVLLVTSGTALCRTAHGAEVVVGAETELGLLDSLAGGKRAYSARVASPLVGLRLSMSTLLAVAEGNFDLADRLLRAAATPLLAVHDAELR